MGRRRCNALASRKLLRRPRNRGVTQGRASLWGKQQNVLVDKAGVLLQWVCIMYPLYVAKHCHFAKVQYRKQTL